MAKKDKLGIKGLDLIFDKELSQTIKEIKQVDRRKEQAILIPLHKITPNPYQPRRVFDQMRLKQLATSIKNSGLINPILVKANGNETYTLVAGERRLRATKLAAISEIRSIIMEITDEKMREIALVENIQRVDLTPIEEATAFKELIRVLNIRQETLAERIGRSRVYVTNTLRLLKLPNYVQDLIAERQMNMGQARPLVALVSDKDKLKYAVNLINKKHLTSQATEDLVHRLNQPDVKLKQVKIAPKVINSRLEGLVSQKLDTKVKITNTQLVIRYRSVNQLNNILKKMGVLEKD